MWLWETKKLSKYSIQVYQEVITTTDQFNSECKIELFYASFAEHFSVKNQLSEKCIKHCQSQRSYKIRKGPLVVRDLTGVN